MNTWMKQIAWQQNNGGKNNKSDKLSYNRPYFPTAKKSNLS